MDKQKIYYGDIQVAMHLADMGEEDFYHLLRDQTRGNGSKRYMAADVNGMQAVALARLVQKHGLPLFQYLQ